jgi:hypothetical protein
MLFETLYRELALGAEIIRQLVAGVTPEEARAKPAPESWSTLEVICHLYDEEREDFRQHLDLILHRPNDPWPRIDPQGWVAQRGYNQRDLTEMLGKFLAERDLSLDWLRNLKQPDWEIEYHSQFGSMKAGDMLSSWVAHDNLHTRQLVELRRARLVQMTQPFEIQYAGEW